MKTIAIGMSLILATVVQADVTLKATNKLPLERKSQTIELKLSDLGSVGEKPNNVHVKDQSGKELLTQAVDTDFDDYHKPDIVIFQSDFGPSESKTFTVSSGAKVEYKPEDFKAHGRFVRERFDDFAWENDKIAHRTYGKALITWKGEPLTSNSIDIWSKKSPRMVIDEWYMVDNYHHNNGDGYDDYSAGTSRGDGGDGLWDGKELKVASNFIDSRVLSNGPIRVLFELDYPPFEVNGKKITEMRRISLDAGSQLDHYRVTYKGGSDLTAGLGLRKMSGDKKEFNKEHGWLSKWEKMEKNGGEQGVAIIADPKSIEKQTEDKQNDLLLVKVPENGTVEYQAGFCWDKAGEITSFEAWNKYVDDAAHGAASPIEVSVEK